MQPADRMETVCRWPLAEMVAVDYLYVVNRSLWNDMKLLLRTVAYVASFRAL
jgi:lipopolysaccharide/colanic/teichoic acid biosynthesis glycosyltransferase